MKLAERLRRSFWRAFEHGQFGMAKGAAYSSILTLFPALLTVASLLELSNQSGAIVRQISSAVGWVLPPGTNSIAITFFQRRRHTTGILYSALGVTLLAADSVMISLMEGFRKAYGMKQSWGFWRERAMAFYLVLLAMAPLAFATVLVVFGNQIEAWMQRESAHLLRPVVLFFWTLARWIIALFTSVAFIGLIYHHGVPKTQSWRRVLPGAALATLLWFPATMFFGWYVTHYANYNVVYGPLGAAIALLVWLYIVCVIVLLGAEFNAQVYPKIAAGLPGTAAPEAPPSQRLPNNIQPTGVAVIGVRRNPAKRNAQRDIPEQQDEKAAKIKQPAKRKGGK